MNACTFSGLLVGILKSGHRPSTFLMQHVNKCPYCREIISLHDVFSPVFYIWVKDLLFTFDAVFNLNNSEHSVTDPKIRRTISHKDLKGQLDFILNQSTDSKLTGQLAYQPEALPKNNYKIRAKLPDAVNFYIPAGKSADSSPSKEESIQLIRVTEDEIHRLVIPTTKKSFQFPISINESFNLYISSSEDNSLDFASIILSLNFFELTPEMLELISMIKQINVLFYIARTIFPDMNIPSEITSSSSKRSSEIAIGTEHKKLLETICAETSSDPSFENLHSLVRNTLNKL